MILGTFVCVSAQYQFVNQRLPERNPANWASRLDLVPLDQTFEMYSVHTGDTTFQLTRFKGADTNHAILIRRPSLSEPPCEVFLDKFFFDLLYSKAVQNDLVCRTLLYSGASSDKPSSTWSTAKLPGVFIHRSTKPGKAKG